MRKSKNNKFRDKDVTKRNLLQEALIENEEKFQAIANSVKDAMILVDEKGKVTYWNPAAEKTFGYSSDETIGKDLHKLVVPYHMCKEGKNRISSSMKVFTKTGTGYFTVGNVELVGRQKDGTEFPAELAISPIELGGKWSALGVVKDITDRKKAEQKLREAEQRYHALFNEAPLGVLIVDPKTAAFVEFNDTAHLQLAYSREEFSKLTIHDIEVKESPDEIKLHIDELLKENNAEFETLHRTKNGDLKNILVTSRTIELEGKKLLHCIYHDITERKQLEDDLRSSEERFRAITNSAMDAIILVDEEDKIIYWNPAAEKTFGYAESEAIGQKLSDLTIPARGHKTHEALLNEIKHNSVSKKHFDFSALRKNGTEFPIDLSVSSVRLRNKNCLVAIVRDISEQKKMELSIKQERDMLEGITENIGAGLVIVDKDYRILWTNNYLKNPYGDLSNKLCYSTFNTLKKVCQDCGPKKIFEGAQSDSREYFNVDLHKKGMPCWFELIATPIKDKDGQVVAALELTVDITEKKELEEKIREERNKLEAITENISASLMLVNKDYKVIWMNKFAQELHGNIVNQKCHSAIHGKDTICSECGVQKILNGKNIDVHQMLVIKNDKTIILEVTATPMKDKDGNIIGVLELGMDLTEIKKLQSELSKYSQKLEVLVKQRTEQLKDTQAKLVKSERLAAIGELAGMIGHDLRNPLSGIKNSAYFLKKKGKEIPEVQAKEMLDIIDKCVDYSNKIVSDLLDYSREIHLELQQCSPRNLIMESLSMMNIPEKMEIVNNVTDQPQIKVDPDKIKRVFINLIKNGIEAMSNVGQLIINSKEVENSLQISFSDTGAGIPDEILPKLFSPLCTSKAQGMGFGLAICKRIIDAHGGTITAKTSNGIGTTFTITLSIEPKTEIGGEKIWIEMPKSSLSMTTRT